MDPVLISVYSEMVAQFGSSTDDILHDPELRNIFLSEVRLGLGSNRTERELLSRLSNLRKKSKLPRSRDVAVN